MQCPSVWVCPILFLMVRLELWVWGRKTTGVKGPSHHITFGNGAHPRAIPVTWAFVTWFRSCLPGFPTVKSLFSPLPPLFFRSQWWPHFLLSCRWVIKLQMSDQVVKVGSGRHRRGKWVQEGLFFEVWSRAAPNCWKKQETPTVTRSDIQQGTEFCHLSTCCGVVILRANSFKQR